MHQSAEERERNYTKQQLKILAERARALAQPAGETGDSILSDLLILVIGREQYGLEIRHVQEVQPLHGLAIVPGLPSYWAGIINLRGRLYPVLDLRRFLGLPGESRLDGKIAVAAAAGIEVALLADDIIETRQMTAAELTSPLANSSESRQEFLQGVTPDLLAVVDLPTLLNDSRLSTLS